METKGNGRIKWIDLAKGVGILFVIIGHSLRDSMQLDNTFCYVLYRFIYNFHMPFLFILNGITFSLKIENYKKRTYFNIKKKAKTCLLPWITYTLIIYAIVVFITNFISLGSSIEAMNIFTYFEKILYGRNPYAFHLWYLITLFIIEVIELVLLRVLGSFVSRINILLCLAIISFRIILGDVNIWSITAIYRYFVWFCVGLYILRLFNIVKRKMTFPFWTLSIIYLMIISVVEFQGLAINLKRGVDYLAIFIFSFGLLFAFQLCENKKSYLIYGLTKIGMKSFVIYLLHQPFFCAFLGGVLYDILHINIWITIFICCACSVVMPLCIQRLCHVLPIKKAINLFLNI